MRIENINGNLTYILNPGETQEIGGLGVVTGGEDSSAFTVGANNQDKTAVNFYNPANDDNEASKMTIITDGSIENYSFNGGNFDAELTSNEVQSFEKPEKTNNVVINASNSTIKSNLNNDFGFTENSRDNILTLINGANRVVDAGDRNTTTTNEELEFISTATSDGAMVIADGNHDYEMSLFGTNAIVKTSTGDDKIITAATSAGNIISTGDGDDEVIDSGTNNVYLTGGGVDKLNFAGLGSWAVMGAGDDDFIDVTGQDNTVYADNAPQNSWLQNIIEFMNGLHR